MRIAQSWATARRRPYWTDLRALSNTPAARAVILIPIVGYWIILNDQIVSHVSDLSCRIVECGCDRNPTPWRLFATYFGLCLIGIGSFIYQTCCGRIVKDYPDATAYARAFTHDISGTEMDRVRAALMNEPQAAQRVLAHQEFHDDRLRELENIQAPLQDQESIRSDLWRNFLQEDYDLQNARCYPGRIAASACYGLGFLTLLFPSLDVFIRVVGVLWRAI